MKKFSPNRKRKLVHCWGCNWMIPDTVRILLNHHFIILYDCFRTLWWSSEIRTRIFYFIFPGQGQANLPHTSGQQTGRQQADAQQQLAGDLGKSNEKWWSGQTILETLKMIITVSLAFLLLNSFGWRLWRLVTLQVASFFPLSRSACPSNPSSATIEAATRDLRAPRPSTRVRALRLVLHQFLLLMISWLCFCF